MPNSSQQELLFDQLERNFQQAISKCKQHFLFSELGRKPITSEQGEGILQFGIQVQFTIHVNVPFIHNRIFEFFSCICSVLEMCAECVSVKCCNYPIPA
jgi:hypothetical protein